ncbi:hypothetical protein EG68_10531 [Paragonimus skrjabini miyazakii]|uniref:Angio-associated migratory cell protein n=1 Tax=Paragonimus skrjabini miyazakii TaxID=59628 RepID=A0A8S9YKU4_9TREM|nr:hypothetical protein EG68_10531 [Paragonimus skrjabini miyazakii]
MDPSDEEDMDFVCGDIDLVDVDQCSIASESSGQDNVSEDNADDVELEGPELFLPPRDDAAMTLQGHKESVFCVTIDPTGTYLVSGGQDHVAIVWDLQTGRIMFTTEKLEDSVTCVAFSSDGNFLAAGDMAGGVRVWLRPEDGRSWTLLRSETVADLSWLIWWQPTTTATRSKSSLAVLAAGDADGLITVWSITAASRPSAGGDKRSKYLSAGMVFTSSTIVRNASHVRMKNAFCVRCIHCRPAQLLFRYFT